MFTEEDREMMLHIRKLLTIDGELPKYSKEQNAVLLNINGEFTNHPLLIFQLHNVFNIMSLKGVDASVSPEKLALYFAKQNSVIPIGGFVLDSAADRFIYKLSFLLHENPKQEFIHNTVACVVKLLDSRVPEIISEISPSLKNKGMQKNTTFH
jgi:hypothetical protein